MQMTFHFFSSPHVTDSGYREVIFISVVKTFEKVVFLLVLQIRWFLEIEPALDNQVAVRSNY